MSGHLKSSRQFRASNQPSRQEQRKAADQHRGSARERGYNARWQKARKTFLSNNPVCIGCLAMDRVEPAAIVDHVDPHHQDPVKFWNTSMWQACCKWHHDSVKQKLENLYVAGKVQLPDLWLNSPTAVRIASQMEDDEAGGGSNP